MKTLTLLLIGGLLGSAVVASAQTGCDTHGGPPRGHRGPPPILLALDANHDHVISAEEIAHAPAALKTLDKNGDGILSVDELRPPLPANAPKPPADARPHAGDPLMLALDADGDGQLSANEIANATASLKALDANKDGQLTPDEFRPMPPEGAPRPE